uniref:hypothetical protein n=1 Tax=Pseudomonas sp. RW407 TaxID=2202894 RepID=UPI0011B7C861|nr:hypothetical protein [Pseudomonas sp. RW407]
MVEAHEITNLIKSKEYQAALTNIEKEIPIETLKDHNEQLSILSQRKMSAANVDIQDAKNFLRNSEGSLTRYTVRKHESTRGLDEKLGLSTESEASELTGYAASYLLNNIVEIIVAGRGEKALERYLTAIRVQAPRKYTKQILSWISS